MADSVFLGSVYATAELRTDGFAQGRKEVENQLDGLDNTTKSKMASLGQSFMKAGTALSIGLTAPLVLFGKASVDTAVEIETKWAEIRKVYGSTADAWQRDSKMMQESVDLLANKFGKTRGQVLDALGAIAAIGYEGPQAIDMLTQSIEFATTGNLELEAAMNGVVAISKIYNVEGEKLRENLALLNTVENTTGASMGDLSEAIEIAGASSKAAGVDIGELSGFVALLRERAVPAGEAANALKTIMTRVYNVTDDAKEVYDKYGISIMQTEKVTGTFNKTVGANADEVERLQKKLVSLNNSYNDYQAKILGVNLSDEDRKKKLDEIKKSMDATSGAIAANSGVTQTVTGTYEKATGKFKDADQVLKELAGKWEKMTDAEKFEVIQSNAGIYQRNKFISIMEDLSSKNSTYVKTLDAIGDSTKNVSQYEKEMAVFLGTSAVKMQQNKAQWEALQIVMGNILLEILIPIGTAFANVAKWVSTLNPAIQKVIVVVGVFLAALGPVLVAIGSLINAVIAIKGAFLALKALSILPTIFSALGGVLTFLLSPIGLIILAIAALAVAGYLIYKNWDTISAFLLNLWNQIVTTGTALWNGFVTWLGGVWQGFTTWISGIWEGIKTAFIGGWNAIVTFFTVSVPAFIAAFLQFWINLPGMILSFVWNVIILGFVQFLGFMLGLIIYGIPALADAIVNFLISLPDRIGAILTSIQTWFTQKWSEIQAWTVSTVTNIVNSIVNWIQQLPGRISAILEAVKSWFVTKWTETKDWVITTVTNLVETITKWINELPGRMATALTNFKNEAVAGIQNTWNALVNEVSQWPGRMFDWGKRLMQSFADGIKNAIGAIVDAFKSGMDNARKMVEGHSPPIAGPFKNIDIWGFNIGQAWAQGIQSGMANLAVPNLSDISQNVSVGQSAPAPVNNNITNSPAFSVNIGMYAGTPMEKREIARQLNESLIEYQRSIGDI